MKLAMSFIIPLPGMTLKYIDCEARVRAGKWSSFKLFLPPTLPFFNIISDSFCLASLSRSRLPFLLRSVCNTTLHSVSQGYSAGVKCAVRRTVKVIPRSACERTIEKLCMHCILRISIKHYL